MQVTTHVCLDVELVAAISARAKKEGVKPNVYLRKLLMKGWEIETKRR